MGFRLFCYSKASGRVLYCKELEELVLNDYTVRYRMPISN